MSQDSLPFRYFEPTEDYDIVERSHLPHWTQAGTICFITWRTWDSIPQQVAEHWRTERSAWLNRHGIDPFRDDWKQLLARLPMAAQQEFHAAFSERWNALLDECCGACALRQSELAMIVGESLQHFDGDRYWLFDYVVMPNHVHVMAAFPTTERLLKQCTSWKHYTAVQINRRLGRKDRFWETDEFDHLVRSEEQFVYLRSYIKSNPARARLPVGEFLHYSRNFERKPFVTAAR